MSVSEIIAGSCGGFVILLALIQIAPIKINPWSAIAKAIGKSINSDVLRKLDEVECRQKDTREALDKHIRANDERNADANRARILQFNLELLREIRHTEDVQAALTEAGLNPDDYSIVSQVENEDGDTYGALAYNEILAVLVHEIQILKKKVEEIK